eukprot:XP_001708756.1 Hypothetical protein GL50803_36674 [Giardia lamblia ATCC 50803]
MAIGLRIDLPGHRVRSSSTGEITHGDSECVRNNIEEKTRQKPFALLITNCLSRYMNNRACDGLWNAFGLRQR